MSGLWKVQWMPVLPLILGLLLGHGPRAAAAELSLDFGAMPAGELPAGFRPALTGEGPPPEWRLVSIEVPSGFPALSDGVVEKTQQTVMAQLSQDPTDERFPLLIYEPEIFADFTATLRFRTVSGRVAQMAGLAFRLQDETNYYVLRASSLGRTFRFYKVVNGVRSDPIGPEIPVPTGEWHTLGVACKGNEIRCSLNGREEIPLLIDSSFVRGRLALWTKSDSVTHFASLRVEYDLVRMLPQRLVDGAMARYPRLLGVTIFGREGEGVAALAASDPTLLEPSSVESELLALDDGTVSVGSTRQYAAAVFPLRDRNGDPLFAVRLRLRTFRGQTDANVAARGRLVADYLEGIVRTADRAGE